MDENKLKEILDKHEKWLNGEKGRERADLSYSNLSNSNLRGSNLSCSDLRGSNLSGSNLSGSDLSGSNLTCSNLSGSDLSGSNLSGSNLRGSDLSGSNLRGSDLDYSVWPLWCGSLKAYVDDRIAIQLLYHTLSVVQHSPYVSDELKRALLTPGNIDAANRFHHVDECGKLKVYNDGSTI